MVDRIAGDPAAPAALGTQMDLAASGLRTVIAGLDGALIAAAWWEGPAALSFTASMGRLKGQLSEIAAAHDRAGDAVSRFADEFATILARQPTEPARPPASSPPEVLERYESSMADYVQQLGRIERELREHGDAAAVLVADATTAASTFRGQRLDAFVAAALGETGFSAGDAAVVTAMLLDAERIIGAGAVDEGLLSVLARPGASCLDPAAARSPEDAAAWWASLTVGEQAAVLAACPDQVGRTRGLPASARDRANRTLLDRDIDHLQTEAQAGTLSGDDVQILQNALAVRASLDRIRHSWDPETCEPIVAQLYVYEPHAFGGEGRAAVVAGDLDTADHVAFSVSGFTSSVAGMTPARQLTIYEETRWLAPGDTVAVVDWMGYDAPSGGLFSGELGIGDEPGVVLPAMATAGATLLVRDINGLGAARAAGSAGDPHVTVIGNSYGSTTAGIAGTASEVPIDDLVLTGSPGAGYADHAGELVAGPDHTWVGSATDDPITFLGAEGIVHAPAPLGHDPADEDFGAIRFQAESVHRGLPSIDGHSRYFAPNTESLANVAAIVTGRYDEVLVAEHRYDPWYDFPQDPEADRSPTLQSHAPDPR